MDHAYQHESVREDSRDSWFFSRWGLSSLAATSPQSTRCPALTLSTPTVGPGC